MISPGNRYRLYKDEGWRTAKSYTTHATPRQRVSVTVPLGVLDAQRERRELPPQLLRRVAGDLQRPAHPPPGRRAVQAGEALLLLGEGEAGEPLELDVQRADAGQARGGHEHGSVSHWHSVSSGKH